MLPQNSQLGNLSLVEVYEYFDMPTLYCAKNTLGTYYLVHWCDVKDQKEGWLYLPVSLAKLNSIRRGIISFYEAYNTPEQGYYLAYVGKNPVDDEVVYKSGSEINKDLLPSAGYFVESIDVAGAPEEDWVFRVLVKNSRSSVHKVATELSSHALDLVHELVVSLMSSIGKNNKVTHRTYSLGAAFSSYDVMVGASDNELALGAIRVLNQLIEANDGVLEQLLLEYNIDPYQLENIYSFILSNKLDISIIPKFCYGSAKESLIANSVAEEKIGLIQSSHKASLPSIKVPQANDIDIVVQLVEFVGDGVELSQDIFETLNSERQVSYYRDAAYALGLLDKAGVLTSEGRFLLSKKTKEVRYKVLANLFELSDFGWNWMKRYQKSSMNDLDPETAEEFVLESVPTLSEKTAKRRATTLVKWLTVLKPYHVDYNDVGTELQ